MDAKSIRDGFITCIIILLLALLFHYVALLSALYIFIPVPIIVLGMRRGIATAVVSAVVSFFGIFFIMPPGFGTGYAFFVVFVGIPLMVLYVKQQSGFRKLFGGYISIAVVFAFLLWVFYKSNGGIFFTEYILNLTKESFDNAVALYTQSGLLKETMVSDFAQMKDAFITSVKNSIPGIMLAIPFFASWALIIITDKVLAIAKINSTALAPLSNWRSDTPFRLFLTGLLILAILPLPSNFSKTFQMVLYIIYFVLGLSFIFWYFSRNTGVTNAWVKILVVVTTLIIPIAYLIVGFLGMLDIFLDIRRFMKLDRK